MLHERLPGTLATRSRTRGSVRVLPRPRQGLRVAFDLYVSAKEGEGVTARTLKNYHEFIEPFLDWLEGQGVTDAASITTDHIRQYVLTFQRRELAASTVHTHAKFIKAWLK